MCRWTRHGRDAEGWEKFRNIMSKISGTQVNSNDR